jgi:mono/diheme cytochrome c family protein
MLGAGDVLDEQTPIVAPNLTPDAATGIGSWTDDEIVRAVRQGVGRDGRRLRADHPAAYYSVMSDADAAALVAYLRSLRPIRNALRRSAPQRVYGETVQPPVTPTQNIDTVEARGAYLVQLGECIGCHTTTTAAGKPFRAMAFGGGRRFVETRKGFGYELSPDPAFTANAADPTLAPGERIVASANVTVDPSGIPYYTPELFIKTIRSGKVAGVRQLSSAMPWIYFRHLTDDDLRAIFTYLRTRPPVRHHVSNSDPATFCAVCGRRHGLGAENRHP